ncbi:mechanosensitive ion channel family protein [Marinobacter sp. X15-166B]|uniref:mechanosensitive ion channel family protein n=1 Tax=Marinobacter sp. X15-166B TaxID=1897620 RepID=UPI00085BB8F7|nr:mechanosensitive ion channel family protein [Marinobacter sp. X15-166B]OEY67111.1 mechanosensitive ion channel protein MscS [Marinobacter sp. X15-166B]
MGDDVSGMLVRWINGWSMLNEGWRVTVAIFILVAATAIVAFVVSRIILMVERRCEATDNFWDDALLHAVRKPAIAFVWLQGVYWAAEAAHSYSEAEIFTANEYLLKLGFIGLLVWTLLGVIKEAEETLASPAKMRRPVDKTTISAVSKLTRAVVIITAVLIVMQSLGYSISGVLAFGGVGGIAVGFAAKDLLANFFGGFIIYFDRPFKVGDWIRSPDRSIEGTVEKIGWRLTTIRTFDKRPLYVPNAAFTTIAVENPSRMTNRRIYEVFGIRYADVRQMDAIVADIRTMLEEHDEIDTDQTLMVNFLAFGDSTLDIMVYTFTKTTQWVKFHGIKQDVLLKISDIIQSYDAEIAFPTRTLHLADEVRVAGPAAQTANNGNHDGDRGAHDGDRGAKESRQRKPEQEQI